MPATRTRFGGSFVVLGVSMTITDIDTELAGLAEARAKAEADQDADAWLIAQLELDRRLDQRFALMQGIDNSDAPALA